MVYSGDWWPEGFTYVQPTLGGLGWYAAGWSTATDENIYLAGLGHLSGTKPLPQVVLGLRSNQLANVSRINHRPVA